MKIYTELGENLTIKNLSTFKTDACNFEVIADEAIDFAKIKGYKVTYDYNDGKNHLAFDEQTYQDYQDKQAQKEALSQATKLMDELSYKTVLDNATDEEALIMKPLYPEWETNHDYKKGEYVNYSNTLYKVLKDHTSQETWTPDEAHSLFAKVINGVGEEGVPEWQQPDSTNAYMKDEIVKHDGKLYVSLVDNNVWKPGAVGSETLWEELESEA